MDFHVQVHLALDTVLLTKARVRYIQYCIMYFKVTKRLDLNCSHHKEEIIIM